MLIRTPAGPSLLLLQCSDQQAGVCAEQAQVQAEAEDQAAGADASGFTAILWRLLGQENSSQADPVTPPLRLNVSVAIRAALAASGPLAASHYK